MCRESACRLSWHPICHPTWHRRWGMHAPPLTNPALGARQARELMQSTCWGSLHVCSWFTAKLGARSRRMRMPGAGAGAAAGGVPGGGRGGAHPQHAEQAHAGRAAAPPRRAAAGRRIQHAPPADGCAARKRLPTRHPIKTSTASLSRTSSACNAAVQECPRPLSWRRMHVHGSECGSMVGSRDAAA